MDNRTTEIIIADDFNEHFSKKELKRRKKKIVKWYDRLTCKKEKKNNKNIQIEEREDEI